MPQARFVVNQPGHEPREIEIPGGRVTVGRAPDNIISLAGDTDVSRYHAVIESRGEDFWLVDLRSSNGTTINGEPIELDRKLKDGDLLGIGGASTIKFLLRGESGGEGFDRYGSMPAAYTPVIPSPEIDASSAVQSNPGAVARTGGISPVLLIAGVGGGLLLVAVVAGLLIYKFSGGCQATVRLITPLSGTAVRGPVTIRVEAEGTKCIDRVIYQLDGEKIASAEVPPYDVVLDPEKLPDLKDGNHLLSVTVEDNDGNKTLQPETVLLAFDIGRKVIAPDNTFNSDSQTAQGNTSTQTVAASSTSVFDVKDMVGRLSKRISSKNEYIFDRDFLEQVRTRANDYASAGYFERARNFRDVINDAFVGEQGLDPPLGYVMAMSRSRFDLNKTRIALSTVTNITDQGQGLWMIQPSLAKNTGYIGRCGTSTLADPDQKCSAIVASTYMKFLVVDLFSGDYLYAVASFGMPPNEAAQFRDGLPPDRRDFWKVLKSTEQRDRVVRFFAAGIVAENPPKFGLNQDKPLSNLYPKK